MKRPVLAALAASIGLGLILALAGTVAAKPLLSKCDIGANRPFLCGKIEVPAIRGAPELGTQKVGFALRPRGDQSRPSLGKIVFIEGGPGYASSNADSTKPTAAVFAPFLRRRELLVIDQRGTGLSSPVDCKLIQRGRAKADRALRACAAKLGPRYQGYTTAESAADIEAVRQALGIRKDRMILYGDSYGTYLGQSYAARYGDGLKGLILSSAYPGNDPYWRTLYPAAERAIRLSCSRFSGCRGDALGRFRQALRKAGTASGFTRQILDYTMLFASSYAPNAYRNLNSAVSSYLRGKAGPLRDLTDPGPPGLGSPRYFSGGLFTAVVCNDYPVPWDRASSIEQRRSQFRAAIEAFRPDDLFAPLSKETWMRSTASGIGSCLPWPGPTSLMEPPIPPGAEMPSDLDTLVIAGEFDAITSVAEARQVEARFDRARFFLVPNRGHASELYYPFRSRATQRIRQFVANLG